jgi:hypothetical protein|tara:strand:- start:95 stop:253 length:159 start_codon:yes stop_codon:yes gene_type:complete
MLHADICFEEQGTAPLEFVLLPMLAHDGHGMVARATPQYHLTLQPFAIDALL